MSECEVLLGVKEVPVGSLIPGKKYFFFSHTIKKQPYNRDLLRAILDKNIELYDHEVLTDPKGKRLVAFGRYAGIVGAFNAIRAYGLKSGLFQLPKAETLPDQQSLIRVLRQVELAVQARELSERKLDIEQEKLKAGRSTNFQLVSFQNDLLNAQNNELNAKIEYLNALTALDRILGTTLDTWEIELRGEEE